MTKLPFEIDIAMPCQGWANTVDDIEKLTRRAVGAVWAKLDTPKSGELSLALMDDAQIQTLNRDYRAKDKPTNVLSFPSEGPAPMLGDIALALETVRAEAAQKNVTFGAHMSHLIIHGFLHLQGYDHETEGEASAMEALEIAALADLNIDNPYEISEP